jgi:archaetidylinositol phosphate synthase
MEKSPFLSTAHTANTSAIAVVSPPLEPNPSTDASPSAGADPASAQIPIPPPPRTWDARAARWLVMPLRTTRVTPNHLTTVRLLIGIGCALAFAQGGYGWFNAGALLLVLSNFIDHTDGELARISGKTSKIGHFYDLAADAFVTVALFAGIGFGVRADIVRGVADTFAPPVLLGCIAGAAVALIFLLRMRIEEQAGKAGTKQSSFAGFETEDVLYLMPIVTLLDGTRSFLLAAAIGAPLFALLVIADYWRIMRRARSKPSSDASPCRATP